MFFDEVIDNGNREGFINTFLGYNHNRVIADGEFYNMQNMTSDNYPLLSPRAKRESVLDIRSDEWNQLTVEDVEVTYEADVTEAHIKYSYLEIAGDGDLEVMYGFTKANVFSELICRIIRLDADKNVISEYEQNALSTAFYSAIPGCKYLTIEVEGTFTDPSDFDPDDIDTYITSFYMQEKIPTIRGMLVKDNKLAYFIDKTLYYNNNDYDFSSYIDAGDDGNSRVQLLSMGAYILIFPLNLYLNTQNPTDKGRLDAHVEDTGTVEYKLCKVDGSSYGATVSATEPQNPTNNQYWLDTTHAGLYVWSDYNKSWNVVATTYISIKFPNLDPNDYFKEGDAVYMNTKFEDINEGSIIQHIGEDYIVVIGIMNSSTDSETIKLTVDRRVPKLDFACVATNRVWGCRKGEQNGQNVNEIYACKLGDPKNWYYYAGEAGDSYAISLGDDGDFTGCVSYQGLPTFFKENNIYKVYGSYPAQYTLYSYDQRGVQKGSERSLAVCGDYLIYKSLVDVCIYDGSRPTGISTPLGKDIYTEGVAGSSMNKYYLSVLDKNSNAHLFVYDLDKNLWHREDDLRIENFAYNNLGQLYGTNKLTLYSFGVVGEDFTLESREAEKHVDWYVETGLIGLTFTSHKYINEITIRAKIDYDASLRVLIAYDDSDFKELRIIEGKGRLESYDFPIQSARADHYKLRLEGRNDVLVYGITTQLEEGSYEDGI